MNSYEIAPTVENVCKSFSEDILGRNAFIKNIVRVIDIFEDNVIIALDGEWGTGKTYTSKHIELVFNNPDMIEEPLENSYKTFYYNAW